MNALLAFWSAHAAELSRLLAQHVLLVTVSTSVAVLVGVPVGIVAARRPRIGTPLSALASLVQTVPSLALFGFLLPLPLVGGIGTRTALVALTLYALLPVIRTTAAGLRAVDRAVIEAAEAMGMTLRQRLLRVELPLALPTIVAGIRVAAVVGVGTVTIAAAIGAGGLGDYIYRGLAMVDATMILAGAVPVAALALLLDGALLLLEKVVARRRRPARAAAAAAVVAATLFGGVAFALSSRADTVVVGSKNFTEQVLLGELLAQTIERYTTVPVERRLNLGGTFICDRALQAGEIDVYVEYSGTALTAIFKQPVARDSRAVLEDIQARYASSGRTLLAPLGFNNTFAILLRTADAKRLGITTVSGLAAHAPGLTAGFGFEFLDRQDGYAGLVAAYGLRFRQPPTGMELSLMYRALAGGQVDVVAGDATAGLIDALDLTALDDDRRYFPPYDAVPVVRAATLLRHPEVRSALARLDGRVSDAVMRQMNRAVDVGKRDPAVVVRDFLDALDRAPR